MPSDTRFHEHRIMGMLYVHPLKRSNGLQIEMFKRLFLHARSLQVRLKADAVDLGS